VVVVDVEVLVDVDVDVEVVEVVVVEGGNVVDVVDVVEVVVVDVVVVVGQVVAAGRFTVMLLVAEASPPEPDLFFHCEATSTLTDARVAGMPVICGTT